MHNNAQIMRAVQHHQVLVGWKMTHPAAVFVP